MSMTANYIHISPQLLALLQTQPMLIEPFLCFAAPVTDPGMLKQMAEKMIQEMAEMKADDLSYLEELIDECALSGADTALIMHETETEGLSLDKAYQNVQFILSGETSDHGTALLSRAITGDEKIGKNLGYGPATFLRPEVVEDIALALASISEQDFINLYHAKKIKDDVGGLLVFFSALKAYYQSAQQAQHAMLVWGA